MKKKSVIFVCVMTLVVAVIYTIGTSFAYFSISFNKQGISSATATSATMSGFVFDNITFGGFDSTIYPGWVGYQVYSAKGTGSGEGGFYKLNLKIGGSSDIYNDVTYEVYKGIGAGSCSVTGYNPVTSSVVGNTVSLQGTLTIPSTCTKVVDPTSVIEGVNYVLKGTYVSSTDEEYLFVYHYNSTDSDQSSSMNGNFKAQVEAAYVES